MANRANNSDAASPSFKGRPGALRVQWPEIQRGRGGPTAAKPRYGGIEDAFEQ